jgi:hypothetical protein
MPTPLGRQSGQEETVGTTVRAQVRVVIPSERLEAFWISVVRHWNQLAAARTQGCEDLLLSEWEWIVLWRGILATRCGHVDPNGGFPVYRALNRKRAEIPGLMWESLHNFGCVSTEWGADYLVVASAEWPSQDEFNSAYGKWLSALPLYALIFELSKSLPEGEDASPAFVLDAVDRGGSIVVQSRYPLRNVKPRDTLWSAIALTPTAGYGPPKTIYMEWESSLIVSEILRAIRLKEANRGTMP